MPLPEYKAKFIDFLQKTGALKLGEFTLKSGRTSPYFINLRVIADGDGIRDLGEHYDGAIMDNLKPEDFDGVFGPAMAGIPYAVTTTMAMAGRGHNKWFSFDRKDEKAYGEATGASKTERGQKLLVGHPVQNGERIVLLDDVITTGATKDEAIALLNSCADGLKYIGLIVGVDRQEVMPDDTNMSAIAAFQKKHNIPVFPVVTVSEIKEYLASTGKLSEADARRIGLYLRVYGTDDVRGPYEEQQIVPMDKSVIPACDVATIEEFEKLVEATKDIEKIGGYKVGFELGLGYGLPTIVETARNHTDKPIIYDHQKAGTDIPGTGKNFARVCKKAGVDAVILFPQAGPETERAWIYHALDQELKVIVGGRMTHPAYAQSEGGWLSDEGCYEMYMIAARAGVNNFVVPGNKPKVVEDIRYLIRTTGVDPILYAPGFVGQGGKISDTGKVAGPRWHAISGSAIYTATDMHAAAVEQTSQL